MKKPFALLLFSLVILLIACEKNETESEDNGQSGTSHNVGKNCLSCHGFSAAGSVYNKALTSIYSGATIKLTSQANGAGTVLATITVDGSGNFHSSNSISFGSGIYAGVTGSNGTITYMVSAIKNGGCNSCHGSTTTRIWAE
jgi:hypothetical protein